MQLYSLRILNFPHGRTIFTSSKLDQDFKPLISLSFIFFRLLWLNVLTALIKAQYCHYYVLCLSSEIKETKVAVFISTVVSLEVLLLRVPRTRRLMSLSHFSMSRYVGMRNSNIHFYTSTMCWCNKKKKKKKTFHEEWSWMFTFSLLQHACIFCVNLRTLCIRH